MLISGQALDMVKSKGKLKVGVIGIGNQGLKDHVPAVLASSDVELIGVADIDKEKLQAFSSEYKKIPVYKHFEDLLSLDKLDFVIIAVPHYLHFTRAPQKKAGAEKRSWPVVAALLIWVIILLIS